MEKKQENKAEIEFLNRLHLKIRVAENFEVDIESVLKSIKGDLSLPFS